MGSSLDQRFERYCDIMVAALQHADREQPARQYLQGLVLPGERKSVEPMAARVAPERVRAVHQSMHHLVAQSDWSDAALMAAVAAAVVPKLTRNQAVHWIIDDTGMPKQGQHSVGVAHQYCGQSGKQDNCQVAVSLSLATQAGSVPIGYRLYLPRPWAEDPTRRRKAGVPDEVGFATKPALALEHIKAAVAAGYPRGTVLADAAYGDETAWREAIAGLGLHYAVAVRSATTVGWGEHQPAPAPRPAARGRPRRRLQRDAAHPPIAVADVARALRPRQWHTLTWREGTAQPLSSRFARLRVRAAHRDQPRAAEWLIIEWPRDTAEPAHYWLSNLPTTTSWQAMIDTVMSRWRIERDSEELKQELGLGHYEGRNWRGFHHHASLCIAAYGFLLRERLAGSKKNARLQAPAVPESFRPRGAGPDATSSANLDRQLPLSPRPRHRANAEAMSLLRA